MLVTSGNTMDLVLCAFASSVLYCDSASKFSCLQCSGRAAWQKLSVEELLQSVQLETLTEIFQKEHITMDVLVEMSNEDLQSIGVTAFGHRHKILRKVKDIICSEEEIGILCTRTSLHLCTMHVHV